MKKSYLMIAAAAGLMLAACSQEDDFVAQNAAAQQGDGAVLFDTYLSNTNTRAGQPGIMTTSSLQKTGFGIFANTHTLTDGADSWPFKGYEALAAGEKKPDFMWNQYVGYEASNWVYSPLKYWPNETTDDDATPNNPASTATQREGVSFFAYAPFVNAPTTTGVPTDQPTTSGISALTDYDEDSDPKVSYIVATGENSATDALQPSKSVDLLWGVSSGFSYHPVHGTTAVIEPAGLPVKNMMKPAIDEKIKFDFKHALARIGMSIVGAFDQQAAGGTKANGTRVTINSIKVITSDANNVFATKGDLNLNNTQENKAEWVLDEKSYNAGYAKSTKDKEAMIIIDNGDNSEMNPNLKAPKTNIFPTVQGVLPTEQDVIVPSAKALDSWKPVSVLANTVYNPNDGYFKAINTPIAETDLVYKAVAGAGNKYLVVDGLSYKIVATDAITVDLTKNVYEIASDAAFTAISKDDPRPKYVNTNSYFVKSGDEYKMIPYDQIPLDIPENTYYTMPTTKLTAAFELPIDATYGTSATTLYTYTAPNYFMVIPAQAKTIADRVVTVTIDYLVTTKDANLEGGISKVQNVISQNVTLKQFTNGKAYNLKLILGLTSVKVEAEVSNWEVGTIESNLPQNLE